MRACAKRCLKNTTEKARTNTRGDQWSEHRYKRCITLRSVWVIK
ncbi:hypothetical protein [Pseudomonas sp. TH31]